MGWLTGCYSNTTAPTLSSCAPTQLMQCLDFILIKHVLLLIKVREIAQKCLSIIDTEDMEALPGEKQTSHLPQSSPYMEISLATTNLRWQYLLKLSPSVPIHLPLEKITYSHSCCLYAHPQHLYPSVILPLESSSPTSALKSSQNLPNHLLSSPTAITVFSLYNLNPPGNLGTILLANSYVPNTVPGI